MDIQIGTIVKDIEHKSIIINDGHVSSSFNPVLLTLSPSEKALISNMGDARHLALFPLDPNHKILVSEKQRFIDQVRKDEAMFITVYTGEMSIANGIYEVLDYARRHKIRYSHKGYSVALKAVHIFQTPTNITEYCVVILTDM